MANDLTWKERLRVWRWRLAIPLCRMLAPLLDLLSRRQLMALGRAMGFLGWLVGRRDRQRAHTHLSQAFPDLPEDVRKRYVRNVFDNLALGFLESLVMHRWPRETFEKQLVNPDDAERVITLSQNRPGIVFVTGHIGNWELCAASFIRQGGVMHVVGRRLDEPSFDAFTTNLRGASGVQVLYADESPRKLLHMLRRGISIGILPDQDITEIDGIFVDFFGRPAWTPVAPARLCLMTGAPMVVGMLVREGERFRIEMGEPIIARPAEGREARNAEIRRLTEAWSARLEETIRRYPDQWVWMHQRWRNTPERIARRRTDVLRRREEAEQSTPDAV